MITRRGFLQSLLAGAIAAHELDIERLLWTPTKTIFIPPAPIDPGPYIAVTRLPEIKWRPLNEGVSPLKLDVEWISIQEFRRRYPERSFMQRLLYNSAGHTLGVLV